MSTNGSNAADRTAMARSIISFLHRFVNGDTRYDQFLCPAPAATGSIASYEANCPY